MEQTDELKALLTTMIDALEDARDELSIWAMSAGDDESSLSRLKRVRHWKNLKD